MKRGMERLLAVVIIFSMAAGMTVGVQTEAKSAKKTPKLAKKEISLNVKGKKQIAVKNAVKGMKVSISQNRQSKKCITVKWKKTSKRLNITAKKAGKCTVKVTFRKKGKSYVSVLKVKVKKLQKPKPEEPSSKPQNTGTPKPQDTAAPKPTSAPGFSYDMDALPIKDVYKDSFMVGAAINGSSVDTMAIRHEGMKNILKKQFNSTTLSNLMKPEHTLDEKATKASADGMPVCKFDTCDEALQFCKDNGIKMRGHTLIWHNQTPKWFFFEDYDTNKKPVKAEIMEKRMESYIKQVITHCQEKFPGVVYCWDVVNECVCTDKNSYIVTKGGWKLRATTLEDNDFTHDTPISNYWYATMGETYVEKAFAFARKYADKDVKLFYNDYNVFQTEKMENIYKMAEELKEKGLIDGIGLQPTVLLTWPALDDPSEGSFRTCLETYAKLGLEIQITELNFKINGRVIDKLLDIQSNRYREFMQLLLKEDTDHGGPCNITSVTVFGICDDYPLYDNFSQNLYLWDKNCNPKPCLYGFVYPGLLLMGAL